jgi:hypothetical protein
MERENRAYFFFFFDFVGLGYFLKPCCTIELIIASPLEVDISVVEFTLHTR